MEVSKVVEKHSKLFKALGDKSRLLIITSLMKEPMYVELISERLKLNSSTVSHHLRILENLNIVTAKKDQYYIMYSLNKKMLDFNIMDIIIELSKKDKKLDNRELDYRKKIITTFINDGRLLSIPVQLKKRRIILEEIAKDFELNKEYLEREVNELIAKFYDDYCNIRREFINEKLFIRSDGVYKRIK
jgi:ArsR family transcriptional regulator